MQIWSFAYLNIGWKSCLNIQLVLSLKVSDELLLRYEYFCRDIPILKKRNMRCHGKHAI